MTDIAALVDALGGMAQKRQLVRRGARDHDLTVAVRTGSVIRVRNGWYSTRGTFDPGLRAVRVGGRLTGISAIAAMEGWVLGDHPLHVSLPANAARLRTQQNRFKRLDVRNPRGVVLHWEDAALGERGTPTSVALMDALYRVVLDESLEDAVACLDWALSTGRLDRIDFEELLLRLPVSRRWIGDWVDEACESLPESLARTRLRLAGHTVRTQVVLGTLERIDLVIDDTIGLEVDGEEHHFDRFEKDRRKDIRITLDHYHAIRPTARMVFYDWPDVLRGIEVALFERGRAPVTPLGNSGDSGRWRRIRPRLRGTGAHEEPRFLNSR